MGTSWVRMRTLRVAWCRRRGRSYRSVELELAGADPDTHLPGLRAHLAGCPACREEHESLRALLTDGPG